MQRLAAAASCIDRHQVQAPSEEKDQADPELAAFLKQVRCRLGGASCAGWVAQAQLDVAGCGWDEEMQGMGWGRLGGELGRQCRWQAAAVLSGTLLFPPSCFKASTLQ